jgi:hypothetical protein
VVECRQDLSLGQKTLGGLRGGKSDPQPLERDLLVELSVGALGEKDASHAPVSQLVDQFVGPDMPALKGLRWRSPV